MLQVSKLTVPSRRSAALFVARLRIARSETPGWRILCSSPASFARRLDSDEKGNSAVRLEQAEETMVIPKWNTSAAKALLKTKHLPARLKPVPLPKPEFTSFSRNL